MRNGLRLLVLAGSVEARRMAQAALERGAEVRAVVSEPPRGPNPMPVPCDLISLDDPSAVAQAVSQADAVLDASHGFDAQMSALGFRAACAAGKPFLSYQRPAWDVLCDFKMRATASVEAAMTAIRPGARVFSACGWASLPACAPFPGEVLFLRQTSPHDRPAPYPFVSLVFGDPPFDLQTERTLFEELQVDTLLCRNLGDRQPTKGRCRLGTGHGHHIG
ncbi:precorrin-6A/cobalt-precorrin-6A reductase [Sulfitobacter aestuariivivens]|uniref:precorrin-6A/cobalt-precorrin-6A reductase n=1 Tax=Sulfitobacter aestuariivivens TaxID=2766981 RepID=UPI0036142AEF